MDQKLGSNTFFFLSFTFYRVAYCLSPQDHDEAWGHYVSIGLGHQQSRTCRTVGGGFLGVLMEWCGTKENRKHLVSLGVFSGRMGTPPFLPSFPFFVADRLPVPEEEEETMCVETASFWTWE